MFQLKNNESALLINAHHLVCDLASLLVMVEDLDCAYRAEERKPPSSELARPFHTFLHWQNELLAGNLRQVLAEYWRRHAPPPTAVTGLPTDRTRPRRQTLNGSAVPLTWPEDLHQRLRDRANAWGVTLQTLLLAGFSIWMRGFQGSKDVCLGVMASGRPGRDFTRTVGYFSNPFPLWLQIKPEHSPRKVVNQVRAAVAGALDHQWLPFPDLVHEIGPPRDLSRTPLFQVMFVHQQLERSAHLAPCVLNDSVRTLQFAGIPCSSLEIEKRVSRYDLTLYLIEVANQLQGHFLYNSDLFQASTIAEMARSFLDHTRHMLSWDPERPLTDQLSPEVGRVPAGP